MSTAQTTTPASTEAAAAVILAHPRYERVDGVVFCQHAHGFAHFDDNTGYANHLATELANATRANLTAVREEARERIANALHGDAYEGVDPAARANIDHAIEAVVATLTESNHVALNQERADAAAERVTALDFDELAGYVLADDPNAGITAILSNLKRWAAEAARGDRLLTDPARQ